MKKIVLLHILLFTLFSCKKKQPYYHGIILNNDIIPISGVTVTDSLQSTISNEKGYFILYRSPTFISDLTFSKIGYETRTVKTVGTRGGIKYKFLNKKEDTLILKKITLPNNGYK